MDSSPQADFSSEGDVDAAIHTYEGEVARLNKIVRSLRHRKNAMKRICRIPDELLGEIFLYVVRAFPRYKVVSTRWPWPCLIVTHVCRHWRRVAIDYHGLWTDVELLRSVELATMFAERAGSCPLTVRGDFSKMLMPEWQAFVPGFVAAHSHHLRSFINLVLPPEGFDTLAAMLGPEPRFESLETLDFILCRKDNSPGTPLLALTPAALPRLKRLHFTGAPRSFLKSLPALHLTSLQVRGPMAKLDAGAWVNILQGLPLLTNLLLWDAFEVHTNHASLPVLGNSIARLPHLETLALLELGSGYSLLQFFEHCAFTATTEVELNLPNHIERGDVVHLMSSLASVASGKAPNRLLMPSFVSFYIHNPGFYLWSTEVPIADKTAETEDDPQYPTPNWTLHLSSGNMEHSIQPFLSAFSFAPLKVLAIDFTMPWLDRPTCSELSHFPTVTDLFVSQRESVISLLDAHDRIWRESDHILLPNLQFLSLGNVAWKSHNNPELRSLERSLGELLDMTLRRRNEHVKPLDWLKLVGSMYLDEWDPKGLEESGMVGEVELDDEGWGEEYCCGCPACSVHFIMGAIEE